MAITDRPNVGKLGPNKAKDALKAMKAGTLKLTPASKVDRADDINDK